MIMVSFPVYFIKRVFPYLEKYYEFSCWSITENIENACHKNPDLGFNLLPKYLQSHTLDVFPDDFIIFFDMPYYNKMVELRNKHPTLLDKNHIGFYVFLLAPFMNPALHPYTGSEVTAMEDEVRRKDIANAYRFLKTIQADGYKFSQKYSLTANGVGSVPISNCQNWLMKLIETEYMKDPFPLDKLLPADVRLPKRRPTFANFLGYNTLLFLRDVFHIEAFVPQELCQFICDYLTACSDNVSKQDLSYKNTYDMLQNCKKTYKGYPIPISWVKD
ncbi:hypothetical protein [Alistipes communis]|uniref:hypothetical protein n=1 Tax=Alistipes communis TaxID=2585118 RepID=UPI00266CD089|nr:hypothetical protein [Alistipes communis]